MLKTHLKKGLPKRTSEPRLLVSDDKHAAAFPDARDRKHRASLLYSLVQSAKLAGVEPWAHLKDVLDRLPNHPHSRIGKLPPNQWATAATAQATAGAATA